MANEIWLKISSGKGVQAGGTKLLHEPFTERWVAFGIFAATKLIVPRDEHNT